MAMISEGRKLGDFELGSIRKSLDQAREEAASTILSLTLQVRDFQVQYGLVKDLLLKQEQEIREREGEVEIKLRKIKEREDEVQKQEKELQEQNSKRNEVISVQEEVLVKERKELALVQKEHQECLQDLAAKTKQLGSLMKSIEDHSKKLKADETKLGYKEKELSKVQKLLGETTDDLQSKEKHIHSIKKRIGDYVQRLEDKEKKYRAMNSSIDKCSVELTRKEKHLDSVKAALSKCSAELAVKQKELELIDKSIKVNSSKLQQEEKKLAHVEKYTKDLANTIDEKEEVIKSLEEKMKTNCEVLELKLIAVKESIRERNEELALKEKELKSVQMSILESSKELEAMKKQKALLEILISGCSEEVESKKKHLNLVERSLKECSNEIGSENAEMDSMQGTASKSCKELEERQEYLTLQKCSEKLEVKERQCEACAKELELKNQEIVSMKKLVDELSKKLVDKEKQLHDKFHSTATLVQPENLLADCNSNSLSVDYQPRTTDNGRCLQLLLNGSFKKHDSVIDEVRNAIEKSLDPGKLVLDAMQGFYPTDLKERDIEFDLSVIQRSCTTLLELLFKISPESKPEVREEARKLALEWKSRMKTPCENSLEVSGFLQLLAAFKLTSSFNRDELQSFVGAIYQNRQALQLRQALGFAEGLSASDLEQVHALQAHEPEDSSTATIDERTCPLILENDMDTPDLMPDEVLCTLKLSADPARFVLDLMRDTYSQHCKNGGAELDASVVKFKILLMEQLIRVSPRTDIRLKEEAMQLAVLWKQNVNLETVKGMEVWTFLLFLTIYGLLSRFSCDEILGLVVKVAYLRNAPDICRFLGFEDKIPKVIQMLMRRRKHLDAARFSCAFGLLHSFPLDSILQNYVELVWKDAKDEATEKELHARRAILHCIADYKLQSIYDTSNITHRIIELEKQRASSTLSSPAHGFSVQQPMQSRNVPMQSQSIPIINVDNYTPNNQPSLAPFVGWQLHNQNFRDEMLLRGGNGKRPRIDMSVDRTF